MCTRGGGACRYAGSTYVLCVEYRGGFHAGDSCCFQLPCLMCVCLPGLLRPGSGSVQSCSCMLVHPAARSTAALAQCQGQALANCSLLLPLAERTQLLQHAVSLLDLRAVLLGHAASGTVCGSCQRRHAWWFSAVEPLQADWFGCVLGLAMSPAVWLRQCCFARAFCVCVVEHCASCCRLGGFRHTAVDLDCN